MIFQFLEINEKKNFSFIMKNENFFLEQKHFDGLLPILWTGLGCWACKRWAGAGARGVCWARAECAGGRARGAARQGARARGQLGGRRARQGSRRGRAGRWAWARGLGVAWAPGLALGSALSALGPFLIRFDSFFFS